jgi:hypothetical protein
MSKENRKHTSRKLRKAYRLLYDYQDKITRFNKLYRVPWVMIIMVGFTILVICLPRLGKGSLGLLAWDWTYVLLRISF